MKHQNHHHNPHSHPTDQSFDRQDHQRALDLDAEVFNGHLPAVLDLADVSKARTVVDVGAGTGTGSRLLRQRYFDATVTCIDNDPQMLDLLRKQDFPVIEANLDDGFPAAAGSSSTADEGVDLVWASSSLHHVSDPSRLLMGIRRALAPHGVLVVVELAGFPSFLSNPSEVLLEQRCHAAAVAQGWNNYPDWAPVIEAAGFKVSKFDIPTSAPVTPAARQYAEQWFVRFAELPGLTEADRGAVKHLLPGLPGELELDPRSTRTAWIATPTQNEEKS